MKEVILNHAKSLAGAKDFNFDKLEVAVTLPTKSMLVDPKMMPRASPTEPFMKIQVNPMMQNSTVQLSVSYAHGLNELMVALYGPSDQKGFKQDPSKAIIDLTIRDTTTKETTLNINEGGAYNLEALKSQLRSMLEEVIYLTAYPKCVLAFQIFIVKRDAPA
jgi:hypothetical protein